MEKSPANIALWHMLLPSKLEVEIHKGGEGIWAKVKNLPGVYTQADNFVDLIEMINDAVFSYFEIPEDMREKFGYYIPEEVKRRIEQEQQAAKENQIEQIFSEVIEGRATVDFVQR